MDAEVIVFDTSAVIRLFERRQADVVAVVRRHGAICVSAITIGEYWRGIASAPSIHAADARRAALAGCLAAADVIGADETIAQSWGALAARSSRRLSHNDLWIVATAAALGLPFCSSDATLLDLAESEAIQVEPIGA